MKKYLLTPQEKNDWCVCAALQAILRRYGKEISQNDIAKNLTPSKRGFLIDDEKIINFFKINGFKYSYFGYNQTPFNEPDMLLIDMAKHHGIIGIKKHIYLLVDFKDPVIKLLDPENVSVLEKNLFSLNREMSDSYSGGFGLIQRIN